MATAWREAGSVAETAGQYVSRTDDAGRPIPHICFKVPTGGGKTLLAAAALQRLNRQNRADPVADADQRHLPADQGGLE